MIKITNSMINEYNRLLLSYKEHRTEVQYVFWAFIISPIVYFSWTVIWVFYSLQYFLITGGYRNIYDELRKN